ncbi:MAG TPA: hypothetical protein VFI47_30245 [Acidimicrobiales bacterium]|nr:hypothetical protein [Acidimicrobiales bacterium]
MDPVVPLSHDREDALVRGLLTGIAVFRWLALAWAAVVLAVNRPELGDDRARPALGSRSWAPPCW